MKSERLILMLLALAFALHPPDAMAQYDVPHGVFSNGGGVRSGSNYSYDTAGQTAVFTSSGGSYVVKSGFWYLADISSTVDVAMASFMGEYTDDAVILRWSVHFDAPFDGFNVCRAEGDETELLPVNEALLPPDGENEYRDYGAIPGRSYTYRIDALEDGIITMSSYTIKVVLPPKPLTLYQNHPNPFNPSTSISFFLPSDRHVNLVIYDIKGRKIKTLANSSRQAGKHTINWNGTNNSGHNVSSGVYYYRLTADKKVITKKMVLLR